MSDRDLDVVVFGATGVTGRQVAAYLAERAQETDIRWAAAARDASKAARVLSEAGVSAPETITADVADAGSLAAMASRARVLLNLVGPYTRYGRPVIEACVAAGTNYADLTGEIPFVRAIIDDFDGPAAAAGIKLVQVCGFEALPPDLAVMLARETAHERWGEQLASVDLDVAFTPPPGMPRPSDGMSGGTLQSMFAVTGSENVQLITDPAALITDPVPAAAVRRVSPIALAPRRRADGAVIAPMAPAAFINPAVIQRSAYLMSSIEDGSAEPFRYWEGLALSGGTATLPLRWGVAGALSASQVALRSLSRATPALRRRVGGALARIVPSSGFGPAADRLEGWKWAMQVRATSTVGNAVEVIVDARGHPGYLATARMLGELGLLLAEDGATPERAGCLTPAVALGTACSERFERAGVRFSVTAPARSAPVRQ
ncbi:MAG: saccharopine dehydrogenase NADP-binding domain-containing protein [Solirubrobacteraceae bacterium]